MSFMSFMNSINEGLSSAAPVVKTLSDLSNQFLNQTNNNFTSGNYLNGGGSGGSATDTPWYKNPLVWVAGIVVVFVLFGKKLKRLF